MDFEVEIAVAIDVKTAAHELIACYKGKDVSAGDARRQQPLGFLLEPFLLERRKSNFFFQKRVSFSNNESIFRV